MLSTEFLLTSLVVVLIPGTGVIYTISIGLFRGAKASVFAAAGCTAGIVPHLVVSVTGLAALLHVSAVAFQTLKFVGVAYLLWLAWAMWKDTGSIALRNAEGDRGRTALIVRGFLLNILNPKLSIFFLAFLPQFVSSAATSAIREMLLMSATFMAMTFVVFVVYGLLAHRIRLRLIDSPRTQRCIQRGFAGVFAALAANLALSDSST